MFMKGTNDEQPVLATAQWGTLNLGGQANGGST
jgi:hypothetical protein